TISQQFDAGVMLFPLRVLLRACNPGRWWVHLSKVGSGAIRLSCWRPIATVCQFRSQKLSTSNDSCHSDESRSDEGGIRCPVHHDPASLPEQSSRKRVLGSHPFKLRDSSKVAILACSLLLPPLSARAQATEPPIALHPQNPHYFLYKNHATALIGSGEHYGAVLNGDFNYHKYLATLSAEGMNYTRLFGGSYVEVPAKSFGILRNDLAPQPGRF